MISVVVTSFIVGVLIGLTGMGEGLLMTPLLVLLYGLPPDNGRGNRFGLCSRAKSLLAAGNIFTRKQYNGIL